MCMCCKTRSALLMMGADLSGWRVAGAVARAEQGVFGVMLDWPDWVVALHTSADSKPEQNHKYLGWLYFPGMPYHLL